ncbi:MAG: F(420)H(2) dehydrogenase subunit L [Methanomassiliicoccales archaeon PtaU1.Bin124]|nr:MAG: F(420)H(2) dehydrogenase subunit L [Methanomassiliicoccales archaeon PtaU1.Bin124]
MMVSSMGVQSLGREMVGMYSQSLFQALIIILLIGAACAAILHKHAKLSRSVACSAVFISASAGAWLAIDVILNGPVQLGVSLATFFGDWTVSLDQIGGYFLLMVCMIMACVAVYSLGYLKEYDGKYDAGLMGGLLCLFFLSLVLVISSNNIIFFLISWELMSVLSFLLVMYEGRKEGVAPAGLLYLIMTHVGTAFITVSFLLMANYTGSYAFSDIAAGWASIPMDVRSVCFVFLLIGFGTKAGMVPVHIWLPAAHPAAPSNISALMSGVMVKMALIMMVRSFFLYLGPVQTWWGLAILLIGSISALVGVLNALKETDIKSTLAYSTVENMGIIFIGLGASLIFDSYGLTAFAALALIATLFHALNHAVFKALLFLGAGSVLHATHTRNMEAMGGLAKRMPYTSAAVLIGLLSMAAIPPLGGFVSEWLLFQSLLLSANIPDILIKIIIPVSIALLALTGALAATMAVRFFGTVFLARPRSERAEDAHESPRSMLIGMGFLAIMCFVLGLASFAILPYIDNVSASVLGVSITSQLVDGIFVSPISSDFSTMAPLLIAVLAIGILGLTWGMVRMYGGKQVVRETDTWDCGTPLGPRNEYTGTAFSSPLVRIFSPIYRSQTEIRTEFTASPYVKKRITYGLRFTDIFEKYFYRPLVRFITAVSKRLAVIQTGSIQAYLAYIFIMLLLLLVIFR